jgi:hypothetical protein
MLTTTTSGTILNLRPDRIFSLIGITGARYFAVVAVWVVAVALHLWTWIGVEVIRALVADGTIGVKWRVLNHPLAVYPLIAIAIYLMHYYCWYLGVLYRRHQHEFPWVLQRHIPDPSRKPAVRLTPYGPIKSYPPTPGRQRFAPRA